MHCDCFVDQSPWNLLRWHIVVLNNGPPRLSSRTGVSHTPGCLVPLCSQPHIVQTWTEGYCRSVAELLKLGPLEFPPSDTHGSDHPLQKFSQKYGFGTNQLGISSKFDNLVKHKLRPSVHRWNTLTWVVCNFLSRQFFLSEGLCFMVKAIWRPRSPGLRFDWFPVTSTTTNQHSLVYKWRCRVQRHLCTLWYHLYTSKNQFVVVTHLLLAGVSWYLSVLQIFHLLSRF
jgi:hypothetical protein